MDYLQHLIEEAYEKACKERKDDAAEVCVSVEIKDLGEMDAHIFFDWESDGPDYDDTLERTVEAYTCTGYVKELTCTIYDQVYQMETDHAQYLLNDYLS